MMIKVNDKTCLSEYYEYGLNYQNYKPNISLIKPSFIKNFLIALTQFNKVQ